MLLIGAESDDHTERTILGYRHIEIPFKTMDKRQGMRGVIRKTWRGDRNDCQYLPQL